MLALGVTLGRRHWAAAQCRGSRRSQPLRQRKKKLANHSSHHAGYSVRLDKDGYPGLGINTGTSAGGNASNLIAAEEQAKLRVRDNQLRVVMGAMRIGMKSSGDPVYIGPASNLTVFARIGSRYLKLVLDTGSARSIIRTRVSEGLAGSELSKGAILRRVPIKNNV